MTQTEPPQAESNSGNPDHELKNLTLGDWAHSCPDIPPNFTIPMGWLCEKNSIHKIVERTKGEPAEVRVAYGAIIPVAVHIDPDGDQFIELVWFDGRSWVNRLVPRAIAKSGRKLIGKCGDAGLPAIEATARPLEQWLAAAEACNRGLIPTKRIARWLGWQPDGSFVASAEESRVEPKYDEQAAALAAHHRAGSFEEWQRAIAHIEPLPVAKMGLYAGLAPTLLRVLKLPSGTVDWSGRSTRGKTTTVGIGLSCWANPSVRSEAMASWKTTMVAAEKRLNLVRGLPVVLDETRVVTDASFVDQVLYQVTLDHGKGRGGDYPSLLKWSTIVLSTGEQSALTFTTHQGASARVLALSKPPFGKGTEENGAIAVAVNDAIADHYGHAGPAFVEKLQAALATGGGEQWLLERHAKLTAELRGANDLSARRAPMVACLKLTAELVERWELVPGLTCPETEVWLSLFAIEEATDDRPAMALNVVREWVASHGASIWTPRGEQRFGAGQPTTGWIGRRLVVEGGDTIGLLPERLREALGRAGVELDTVLPSWKENGTLLALSNGRTPFLALKKIEGHKSAMYVFAPGLFTGGDDDD